MSSAVAATCPRRNNFEIVIEVSPRRQSVQSQIQSPPPSSPSTNVAQSAEPALTASDDELSDQDIARLLCEAEERMNGAGIPSLPAASRRPAPNAASVRLPKLDPGSSLPKPPITSKGTISRISDSRTLISLDDEILANNPTPPTTGRAQNNKKEKSAPATAGPKWYDIPRTDLGDAAVKRDLQIIKARNVLDPHRHYRKDSSTLPEFSQIGTVIEGNTEFFSSRINRKDRKKTIVDEILADGTSSDRFKKRYHELQATRRSGKKEFYKKLKMQRKKFKFQE